MSSDTDFELLLNTKSILQYYGVLAWLTRKISIQAFNLFRPMEFSIQLHTIKSEWSIVYIVGSQVIISKNICFSFFEY